MKGISGHSGSRSPKGDNRHSKLGQYRVIVVGAVLLVVKYK